MPKIFYKTEKWWFCMPIRQICLNLFFFPETLRRPFALDHLGVTGLSKIEASLQSLAALRMEIHRRRDHKLLLVFPLTFFSNKNKSCVLVINITVERGLILNYHIGLFKLFVIGLIFFTACSPSLFLSFFG